MDYTIGAHRIDIATREITCDGVPVAVEPKVFDLLLYLVQSRARVVTKDELVDRLWNGRAVSDAALSSCVKAARRALGDDGQRQRLIRTIHCLGFRFVGAVEEATRPVAVAAAPAVLLAPAVAAAAPEEPSVGSRPAPDNAADNAPDDLDLALPRRPSVAVLPIDTLDGDDRSRLLAAGLARDATVRLARTRWLFVAAGASAARLHAEALDPAEIGRRLGVRYVVHGSLMMVGPRLRLAVTLADTVRGCEVWAEIFDRTIDDLFAIQDELGDLIVAAVETEIEQKERRRALLRPFASLDAWSAYHRACHHLFRYTAPDCDRAAACLDLAASLDPDSARVQAGLSFCHWQRAFLELTPDREDEIAQAVDHAWAGVALDPLDPLGHWALGRAMLLRREFDVAVEELQAAVDLNPNFAVGQYSLAFGMGFTGERLRGFDCIAKARRLSPYDPMTYAFMAQRAVGHAFVGQTDEAVLWSARAVEQPNAHYHILAIAAWCHELAGLRDRALTYTARLRELRPRYCRANYFRAFPFPPDRRAVVDGTLAVLGL